MSRKEKHVSGFLGKRHTERTKARISSTKLIARLQAFALDEKSAGETVTLTREQIQAINILLKKSVPDLQSITHSGGDTPLMVVSRVELVPLK